MDTTPMRGTLDIAHVIARANSEKLPTVGNTGQGSSVIIDHHADSAISTQKQFATCFFLQFVFVRFFEFR